MSAFDPLRTFEAFSKTMWMSPRSRRTGIAVTVVILLASLVPLSQPSRHAAAWRVPPEDKSYVDRALTAGFAAFGMSREEYRGVTRPTVDRNEARTCVALATHRTDGGGSYIGCYDSQTGASISERAIGYSFGAERLWDRFGGWFW